MPQAKSAMRRELTSAASDHDFSEGSMVGVIAKPANNDADAGVV